MEHALEFLRAAVSAAQPWAAPVRLYDPVPMALARKAGIERAQLLVEADQRQLLQSFLRSWRPVLTAQRSAIRWHLEVDPQEV